MPSCPNCGMLKEELSHGQCLDCNRERSRESYRRKHLKRPEKLRVENRPHYARTRMWLDDEESVLL